MLILKKNNVIEPPRMMGYILVTNQDALLIC